VALLDAILGAICRFAAADPRWALFISGVLAAALLGVIWAWAERLERPS
jgi:RsiW-degrading membrane proteinase PrsW (M82 family)